MATIEEIAAERDALKARVAELEALPSFGAGYGCGWGDACSHRDYNPDAARAELAIRTAFSNQKGDARWLTCWT